MFVYIASQNSVILPSVIDTPNSDDYAKVADAYQKFTAWGFSIHEVETLITSEVVFSYTNALVINDIVLVPQYYDPSDPNVTSAIAALQVLDDSALDVFQQAFPGKTVIPIHVPYSVVGGQGSIHCVTMTRPRGS
jgi:agmatine/peptidylarginine deiminase